MSWDFELREQGSKKVCELPFKHVMIGGTYAADYDPETGIFTPKPISEATLNVTYNYGRYYYEAAEGDERFAYVDSSENSDYGIQGIEGKTGAETVAMFDYLIDKITASYRLESGDWKQGERTEKHYYDPNHHELDLFQFIHQRASDDENRDKYTVEETSYTVSEGDTDDYWEPTAANALRPLYQLKTMAQLRPDGVWHIS